MLFGTRNSLSSECKVPQQRGRLSSPERQAPSRCPIGEDATLASHLGAQPKWPRGRPSPSRTPPMLWSRAQRFANSAAARVPLCAEIQARFQCGHSRGRHAPQLADAEVGKPLLPNVERPPVGPEQWGEIAHQRPAVRLPPRMCDFLFAEPWTASWFVTFNPSGVGWTINVPQRALLLTRQPCLGGRHALRAFQAQELIYASVLIAQAPLERFDVPFAPPRLRWRDADAALRPHSHADILRSPAQTLVIKPVLALWPVAWPTPSAALSDTCSPHSAFWARRSMRRHTAGAV
jgi:hypothetical protein